MNIELAQFLKRVCDDVGNQECDLREDYSGRGMMGRQTAGIVVESVPTLLADVLQYFSEHTHRGYSGMPLPEISDFRVDSMGRQTILYWRMNTNLTVDTTSGIGHCQTTSQSFSETYFYEELTRFRQFLGNSTFWEKDEEIRENVIRGLEFVYLNTVPDDNSKVEQKHIDKWKKDFHMTLIEYNRRGTMMILYPKRNAPDCPICQRNNGVSNKIDGVWRCYMVDHPTPIVIETTEVFAWKKNQKTIDETNTSDILTHMNLTHSTETLSIQTEAAEKLAREFDSVPTVVQRRNLRQQGQRLASTEEVAQKRTEVVGGALYEAKMNFLRSIKAEIASKMTPAQRQQAADAEALELLSTQKEEDSRLAVEFAKPVTDWSIRGMPVTRHKNGREINRNLKVV